MRLPQIFRTLAAASGATFAGAAAWAQEAVNNGVEATVDGLQIIGQPRPSGIALQPAMSTIAENTHWLDGMLNWIITAIVLLLGCETARQVTETGYGGLAAQFKDFHASLVLGTMAKILGRHAGPLCHRDRRGYSTGEPNSQAHGRGATTTLVVDVRCLTGR